MAEHTPDVESFVDSQLGRPWTVEIHDVGQHRERTFRSYEAALAWARREASTTGLIVEERSGDRPMQLRSGTFSAALHPQDRHSSTASS